MNVQNPVLPAIESAEFLIFLEARLLCPPGHEIENYNIVPKRSGYHHLKPDQSNRIWHRHDNNSIRYQ